ncbi:MAG: DNA sulfur modification protein DndB [Planctomycetota bacterium]|nr:DNA sulfur modification protein DndB [Planctomycetota bacterium]
MAAFEYIFPSIRGVQAGREYYISMCPLRLIPRIFLFDEEELRPELRAQRSLNKQRVPEIARYIVRNPKGYTFSALTASIDGKVKFEPLGDEDSERNIGRLHVPMNARFVINDGQHRRAAIEAALHENPDLGDETISVVFFLDVGLKRCQQMFADLNRFSVRTTPSLGLLYDHRDEDALVAKTVMERVPVFNGLTETERSSISNRSIKLFTLSGISNATQALLVGLELDSVEAKTKVAVEFWTEVSQHVGDWQLARQRKVSAADLRRDYVHAHTLALAALALVGKTLLSQHASDWKKRLKKLETLDWSRGNASQWEGRAMNAGRLSKRNVNVALAANLIKKHLKLELTADEQTLESQFRRNRNGRTSSK